VASGYKDSFAQAVEERMAKYKIVSAPESSRSDDSIQEFTNAENEQRISNFELATSVQ